MLLACVRLMEVNKVPGMSRKNKALWVRPQAVSSMEEMPARIEKAIACHHGPEHRQVENSAYREPCEAEIEPRQVASAWQARTETVNEVR